MNFKRLVLAAIVIALTFSVGYVTFKTAQIFKNFVLGESNDCSQRYDPRRCSNSDNPYRNNNPLR